MNQRLESFFAAHRARMAMAYQQRSEANNNQQEQPNNQQEQEEVKQPDLSHQEEVDLAIARALQNELFQDDEALAKELQAQYDKEGQQDDKKEEVKEEKKDEADIELGKRQREEVNNELEEQVNFILNSRRVPQRQRRRDRRPAAQVLPPPNQIIGFQPLPPQAEVVQQVVPLPDPMPDLPQVVDPQNNPMGQIVSDSDPSDDTVSEPDLPPIDIPAHQPEVIDIDEEDEISEEEKQRLQDIADNKLMMSTEVHYILVSEVRNRSIYERDNNIYQVQVTYYGRRIGKNNRYCNEDGEFLTNQNDPPIVMLEHPIRMYPCDILDHAGPGIAVRYSEFLDANPAQGKNQVNFLIQMRDTQGYATALLRAKYYQAKMEMEEYNFRYSQRVQYNQRYLTDEEMFRWSDFFRETYPDKARKLHGFLQRVKMVYLTERGE